MVFGGIGNWGSNGTATEVAQLAHAARLLHVGSWEWDIETGEVRWSAELYTIFGQHPVFAPSYDAFVELVHPGDRDHVGRLIENALQTGAPLEFEHRIVRPDGQVRVLHCRGEAELEDGRAVRMFGICQDVTERKRIQDELAITRELAFSVEAATSLERALDMCLSRLCRYGQFALGQAWFVSEDDAYLEFAAAWNGGQTAFDSFITRSEGMTFERGTGLPGKAWADRQPVWVDDVKSNPDLPRASFAREAGLGSGVAVPVPSGSRIVAVLEFFGSEVRGHDAAVEDLVSRVATQLGAMLERKRADLDLRMSEERFRLLIDSVEDCAIVMVDRAGNIAGWNPAAERVTGYSDDQIIGCHVSRLYAQEALEQGEPERHLRQAAEEGRIEHSGWWVREDGMRYRADVSVTALRNGVPEPRGYSYVIRDVTQRRRLDDELDRLRVTTACTHDAIISATAERGIITSWNLGAKRLFGYSSREMIGRPIGILAEAAQLELSSLLRCACQDSRAQHHDIRCVGKNGSALDLALTVAPVDSCGEVTLIARDVTETKRAEQYVERIFGTYLDRDVAEHILREGPALKPKEVDITTMFVDIRGFTAYAERFEPGEVVQTLNCLFDLVVPIIAEHHGHVDKFVGDGLLAVFGVPEPRTDHADLALEAALHIGREAQERFQGDLEIGIGIDSGKVIAGNVGGGGRLDFTVIGDAVNTAARIEGATRDTGDMILYSDQTLRRLQRTNFPAAARMPVAMKGKREPVQLHALEL